MSHFDTDKGIVWAPMNPLLESFYNHLAAHQSVLGNSRFYEDLIEIYETLEHDLKEENHESVTTE
ncbi:hypothetical protein [Rossellomorea marisflavi]|uniref:hypothetical protein n=1 Tax=Rossellomorea marisflavi TaxID=189381 RepID=UPI003D2F2A8B